MKRIKIIGIIISFVLSFILHFLYNIFPNFITSIISPVNESIWEHMKLIITSNLIFGIIEYIIYKKKDIKYHNFLLSYAISSIIGIIIYLILYIPIDIIFGHSLIIAIILLLVTFVIVSIINYYIMNLNDIKYSNIIGLLLIKEAFVFVVFVRFMSELFIVLSIVIVSSIILLKHLHILYH